jgi:hypothetical protein
VAGAFWTWAGWTALVAIGTLGLGLFALAQVVAFNRSERRRTQPIAIAHNAGGELSRMQVFLTNEGSGTAFNVRFGVKLDGREYAVGGGRGHRFVVAPGSRVPEEGHFEVEVHVSAFVVSTKGRGVYARRQYWARYENAFGKVWQTTNPADPLAASHIAACPIWRRLLIEHHQDFGRWWDERIVNRWTAEEVKAAREGRELSRRQLVRRWLEKRMR